MGGRPDCRVTFEQCFALSTLLSLCLLLIAGIYDICYNDFKTCENFLYAFLVSTSFAFIFYVCHQGNRLYFPDEVVFGLRLKSLLGSGVVLGILISIYIYFQICVYRDSAQNPYIVTTHETEKLASFSSFVMQCRIRLAGTIVSTNRDAIYGEFSEHGVFGISATLQPRVMAEVYENLNITDLSLNKAGSQLEQRFSIQVDFHVFDLDTLHVCNTDDCGFQIHIAFTADAFIRFLDQNYGTNDYEHVIFSMKISKPEDAEDINWAVKASTRYHELPYHYQIDSWIKEVDIYEDWYLYANIRSIDPDAFSCFFHRCINVRVPTNEDLGIQIETRAERRAFDFNSIWTAFVATVSMTIGVFSFLFRNVLPKRFFFLGTKSFKETQETYQENSWRRMSMDDAEGSVQKRHPEIQLEDYTPRARPLF